MTLEGYELIKHFEGCRLKAYRCPAGVLTIGYGNTTYLNGSKVKENDVITQEQADALFKDTVDKFEYQVKMILGDTLKAILPESSISALVSFAYNVGITAFAKSTLLRIIRENKNNLKDIEIQFKRWNKANGKILEGLVKRRNAEFEMYKNGVLSQYSNAEQEKIFSSQFKCNYK
jgi:lysozyme